MRLSSLFLLGSAVFFAVACESCRFGAPVDGVVVRTPGTWVASSSGEDGRISTGWLADFRDDGLSAVVGEAMERNRSLLAVAARWEEAREVAEASRARQRPKVGLGGNTSVTEKVGGEMTEGYGMNVGVSWEVDLWGRLGNLRHAAEAEELAAREDYRAARLSLAANTAKTWCNLISVGQDLALAKVTLDSFEKNLRIIERNYRGTGEGALDVRFGRTNVAAARRAVEARSSERDEAARVLQLLLGRYPDGAVASPPELPLLATKVPTGLPSGLLERRPDLCASRARLFASAERAEAARKELLPTFSLTASGGSSSARLADLLALDDLAATVAGRFSQILSEGGAPSADVRAALARNKARLHEYTRLALDALREVESALAAEGSLARQEAFLQVEVKQAVQGERQAERDYAEGVNPNILSALEAQRRANNARASMIRLRNQRLQNRINLHLALGGDFRTGGF